MYVITVSLEGGGNDYVRGRERVAEHCGVLCPDILYTIIIVDA